MGGYIIDKEHLNFFGIFLHFNIEVGVDRSRKKKSGLGSGGKFRFWSGSELRLRSFERSRLFGPTQCKIFIKLLLSTTKILGGLE